MRMVEDELARVTELNAMGIGCDEGRKLGDWAVTVRRRALELAERGKMDTDEYRGLTALANRLMDASLANYKLLTEDAERRIKAANEWAAEARSRTSPPEPLPLSESFAQGVKEGIRSTRFGVFWTP